MLAITSRILKQLLNDKRTLGLLMVAPMLIITLLYFVLGDSTVNMQIGIKNSNDQINQIFNEYGDVVSFDESKSIEELLKDQDLDVYIEIGETPQLYFLENDATKVKIISDAFNEILTVSNTSPRILMNFIYGAEIDTTFASIAFVLLGYIPFFFILLLSGIAFVGERTKGTLERLLMTPVSRVSVVSGYTVAYGIVGAIQGTMLVLYVKYVLQVPFMGSLLEAIIIMIVLAFSAVSIGSFISIFAKTEFQVIQAIPIVVIPQVFFAGLFTIGDLPFHIQNIKYIMPIYYGCTALKHILIWGTSILNELPFVLLLVGVTLLFSILNVFSLKKYRLE